jgi:hypothetical protein
MEFEQRIEALDLGLFAAISTQSGDGDRTAWLALQRAVRTGRPRYAYLEIGSHLGGSIQQHLLDPRCDLIYSIDKRPASQPDDRGQMFHYAGNSSARMLENLRAVDAGAVAKVVCIDADARDIDPARIERRPDFCFLDGEHTRAAVVTDFTFCLGVAAPDAVIAFHDDNVIYPALVEIAARLRDRRIPFRSWKMRDATFAICLRDGPAADDPGVKAAAAADGSEWLRRLRFRAAVKRYCPRLVPLIRYLKASVTGSRVPRNYAF